MLLSGSKQCLAEASINANNCPVDKGFVIEDLNPGKWCAPCEVPLCKRCEKGKRDVCIECDGGFNYSEIKNECMKQCEFPESERTVNGVWMCTLECIDNCEICVNDSSCEKCYTIAPAHTEFYKLHKDKSACTEDCPDYTGVNTGIDPTEPCQDCVEDFCKFCKKK